MLWMLLMKLKLDKLRLLLFFQCLRLHLHLPYQYRPRIPHIKAQYLLLIDNHYNNSRPAKLRINIALKQRIISLRHYIHHHLLDFLDLGCLLHDFQQRHQIFSYLKAKLLIRCTLM